MLAPASINPFHGRRFAFLLGFLVLLVLIVPAFGDDPKGEADVSLLFSVVVLGFATAARRTLLASAFVAVWLVLTWLRPLGATAAGEIATDIALLAVCLITIESALRRALRPGDVDAEMLCAAVSAYMIMGVGWAAVYTALQTADPGAFALQGADAEAPWSALLYFSFATLTTLGYGDISPASSYGRAFATVEAVSGTVYLAILIAYLVSNFRGRGEAET